ncbi:MAG: ABC transporter permease [Bacteriovoracia bacterium]
MRKTKYILIWALFGLCVLLFLKWGGTSSSDVQNLDQQLKSPSFDHLMGTDFLGRDLGLRIVFGARVSLFIAIVTALTSTIFGTLYGAISAICFLRGKAYKYLDLVLTRLSDFFYIFPPILIAMFSVLMFGQGFVGIIVAISFSGWMSHARLVRAQVIEISNSPHVEAARAIGAKTTNILWFHVFPLMIKPMMVSLMYLIPVNILSESFLSFVGLGVQAPLCSWGTLLADGWRGLQIYPHLFFGPGIVFVSTMLVLQILGKKVVAIKITASH